MVQIFFLMEENQTHTKTIVNHLVLDEIKKRCRVLCK
ncbi:hypothetical protein Sarmat_00482 [Rickettsiales endosymbiont of Paramecium tredecaurelia]|nr:hypothetical protein [Candidatus Sarmatiella mevalonica]